MTVRKTRLLSGTIGRSCSPRRPRGVLRSPASCRTNSLALALPENHLYILVMFYLPQKHSQIGGSWYFQFISLVGPEYTRDGVSAPVKSPLAVNCVPSCVTGCRASLSFIGLEACVPRRQCHSALAGPGRCVLGDWLQPCRFCALFSWTGACFLPPCAACEACAWWKMGLMLIAFCSMKLYPEYLKYRRP